MSGCPSLVFPQVAELSVSGGCFKKVGPPGGPVLRTLGQWKNSDAKAAIFVSLLSTGTGRQSGVPQGAKFAGLFFRSPGGLQIGPQAISQRRNSRGGRSGPAGPVFRPFCGVSSDEVAIPRRFGKWSRLRKPPCGDGAKIAPNASFAELRPKMRRKLFGLFRSNLSNSEATSVPGLIAPQGSLTKGFDFVQ